MLTNVWLTAFKSRLKKWKVESWLRDNGEFVHYLILWNILEMIWPGDTLHQYVDNLVLKMIIPFGLLCAWCTALRMVLAPWHRSLLEHWRFKQERGSVPHVTRNRDQAVSLFLCRVIRWTPSWSTHPSSRKREGKMAKRKSWVRSILIRKN